jgi:hypothetical protein
MLVEGRHSKEKALNQMRLWLSGPRILNCLVRPGISLGREDWNPRLPSYRRYELRKGLRAAAEARGEPMTRDEATGGLDSAGNLAFPVNGTREEIVGQIMEIAAAWGRPMPREKAEKMAYAATASPWPWLPVLVSTAIWATILLAVFAAK